MAAPLEQDSTNENKAASTERLARQKFNSTKTWFKEWIGFDPQVVEAASVTDTVRRTFSGNVVSATGSYFHSLFPIVDVTFLARSLLIVLDLADLEYLSAIVSGSDIIHGTKSGGQEI
jgi:hypothetical protein